MNDLETARDHIKATVTMDDVCERLGIDIPHNRKIPSIYRPEKTPSLHLYKADYFDYATGQGGDVIRFVMDHEGWSFPKAVRWIARLSDTTMVTTRKRKPVVPEAADLTSVWNITEFSSSLDELSEWKQYSQTKWGLDIMTVLQMGSKIRNDTLWTPHWHGAVVRGIKIRQLDGSKHSWPGSQYTHGLYRTTAARPHRPDRAVIVEGESDTWALENHQTIADVYGLPSGANLWRDQWRTGLAKYRAVYVVTDMDEAGMEAQERIVGSLKSGPEFGGPDGTRIFVQWPPGGRVAEALIDGYKWRDWLTVQRG